jgi:DNA-binding beta-propeller fold protein YncE
MKPLTTLKHLFAAIALFGASANAGTLFCGAYPDWVLVIDESAGKVVDRIKLDGLPTSLRLSQDKKTIYVTTNDHGGIEVIDVATHKITNHFALNDATHKYRIQGGAPDPDGKVLYTTTTLVTKLADRYELGKAKYTVIDLAQQKIVKTVDQAGANGNAGEDVATAGAAGGGGGGGGGGRGGGGFEVSPDGKYLYQFGATITVLKAEDFSVVERIQLEQPDAPAMQDLGLGGMQEALSEPGQRVSIFNYSDPIVHNRVFGLARFDLNTRKFDFTAIGPAPVAMTNLRITPDKKEGYLVSTNGTQGNKRCEFWAIDLTNTRLERSGDVPCRTRFSFGISTSGKKLYIYGAGFEIEVYDAVTFKKEATWDLGNDMTGGGLLALP